MNNFVLIGKFREILALLDLAIRRERDDKLRALLETSTEQQTNQ